MNNFERNIQNIHGDEGRAWLAELSEHVHKLQTLWGLRDLKPVDNLSFNYVLSGYQQEKPVVLKLSLNRQELYREMKAAEAFAPHGGVLLLNYTEGALLLQACVPGTSLKEVFQRNNPDWLPIACAAMKKLHQAPLPKEGVFPSIQDLLSKLNNDWNIPKRHLTKAREWRDQLLQVPAPSVLLHGDLHLANILLDGEGWRVIDPKGVIGRSINEIWAFVQDPRKDLRRISDFFGFDLQEAFKWYYVHVVLSACWNVQDNIDTQFFLDIADALLNELFPQ